MFGGRAAGKPPGRHRMDAFDPRGFALLNIVNTAYFQLYPLPSNL